MESRGETCFLVTYYFTQCLLPQRKHQRATNSREEAHGLTEFVDAYGSYLKMQTCLSYAAILQAEDIVDSLLAVAKHDPRHKEVMKQMSRTNSMVFYEPSMLSAVLQRLQEIQRESKDRKLAVIDMCASAFPDVRPWQVKKACGVVDEGGTTAEMDNLYYSYLSLLLHPIDGHDAAHRDKDLVKEWCLLSVARGEASSTGRKKNFFAVASRASSDHRVYNRDLVFLLKLAMQLQDNDLALDIAGEILEDKELSLDQEALGIVLMNARKIAENALQDGELNQRGMRRVLRLLKNGAASQSAECRKTFNVPEELLRLLNMRTGSEPQGVDQDVVAFMSFLREEAMPQDLLKTLASWSGSAYLQDAAFPTVHTLLRRGANASRSTELSTTLLRLRRARVRRHIVDESLDKTGANLETDSMSGQTIWRSMSNGMVTVAK